MLNNRRSCNFRFFFLRKWFPVHTFIVEGLELLHEGVELASNLHLGVRFLSKRNMYTF